MSKSLGNFFTVREVLRHYRPEVVRFFILNSHYRSPLNYSEDHLEEANAALTRLYTALRGCASEVADTSAATSYRARFEEAMNDDFNTPEAVAVLFELAREVNRRRETDAREASRLAAELRSLGGVLGLLQADADAFLQASAGAEAPEGLSAEAIQQQIDARLAARQNKDWATADRIRDQMKEQGILLEDGPGGCTWRRV